MYDNIDELMREIAALEDNYLELKEIVFRGDQIRFGNEEGKAPNRLAEVFCSIANSEGGVVVFGVRDDGAIIGIDPTKRNLLEQFVINVALNNCKPMLEPVLNWINLPDEAGILRLCLKTDIPRSRFYVHQTLDGRFLKRIGSHIHPIPAEQLGRLFSARSLAIPFEERPALGVSMDMIDRFRFEAYYKKRFGRSTTAEQLSFNQILVNLKLAIDIDGKTVPTNLGILLFNEHPEKILNGAVIDIAAYRHNIADGNTTDTKQITGPLPEQILHVLHYFQTSPLIATISKKENLGRRNLPSYADTALQEAVVNAVVHREYELTGSQIIVRLFPDRIEIQNPGGLHNTLTEENLYAGCQPVRRNQLLAGFMRDFESPITKTSFMEARGEGFLNLVRNSVEISGKRPEIKRIGDAVKLSIFAAIYLFDK
jgi:predicted HTH transcriptional regulator